MALVLKMMVALAATVATLAEAKRGGSPQHHAPQQHAAPISPGVLSGTYTAASEVISFVLEAWRPCL